MQAFKQAAYISSQTMARERGAFPIYDATKEVNNPFLNRGRDKSLLGPRRNISLLTIAPTGSTSIEAQVSSGLEPVFKVAYKRRKKINPREGDKADFIDQNGDHWKEYNVFHHHFITWFQQAARLGTWEEAKEALSVDYLTDSKLDELIQDSPYHQATANEIDWVAKVRMQGMVQKHIDHSISVTVNIPSSATEADVKAIYEAAYKEGCKGITVYRDGSRSGVLISKDETTEGIKDNNAPTRPKSLEADVIEFQNKKERWVAVIGKLKGRPYEVFVGRMQPELTKFASTKKYVFVVKEKTDKGKKYFVQYNGDRIEISNIFNPEYWNYAKFISGLLRHGVPMQYVYETVKGMNMDDDSLNSWKSGVARILKRYIANGVKSKDTCASCGAEGAMEFVEGCETCKACGSSKCS